MKNIPQALQKDLKKSKSKKSWAIAMAYVGALTGAGLASGQELMQYFVPFGYKGLAAVVIVGILHTLFGAITVSFGSYFLAQEQNHVLSPIAPRPIQKMLDTGLMLTCMVVGFVMIAGAGSNLNQQFGTPIWFGSALCAVLCLVVSLFDFSKVTAVIGSFTPLILGFILLATVYVFGFTPVDMASARDLAVTTTSPMSNIVVSLLNYFAMCMMTGSAVAFVLGGDVFDSKVAHKGGLIGGFLVGLITALETFTLFASIQTVGQADIPMQALVSQIHPALGTAMAIVIYGMIFNTAISLFYALDRRLVGEDKKKFVPVMALLCGIGFLLSSFGFKRLLSIVFPAIGYLGFLLIAVLFAAYFQNKKNLKVAGSRREALLQSIVKQKVPGFGDPAAPADPSQPVSADDYMGLVNISVPPLPDDQNGHALS